MHNDYKDTQNDHEEMEKDCKEKQNDHRDEKQLQGDTITTKRCKNNQKKMQNDHK